ncbi:MAG: M48 family peptidase [Epsilonproteobacteria bacterium]|nr:MAG: M48 family peptidase [Campylobacterota bacterium]
MKLSFKHIIITLASALLLAGCVGHKTVTPQQESALGERESKKLLSQVKLSKDYKMNRALRNVGTRIARVTNRPQYKWKFYLVDNPKQANAVVLPGGKVFVNTGLFKYAANENELAVVVGHEVAHALASHGIESAQRQQNAALLGAVLQIGMGIAGVDPNISRQVNQVYGHGASLGYIKPYSREKESEADSAGLILMARAGYNPRSALTFWNKFGKAGRGTPEYLSTHPAPANRIAKIKALMPIAMAEYNKSRIARR